MKGSREARKQLKAGLESLRSSLNYIQCLKSAFGVLPMRCLKFMEFPAEIQLPFKKQNKNFEKMPL